VVFAVHRTSVVLPPPFRWLIYFTTSCYRGASSSKREHYRQCPRRATCADSSPVFRLSTDHGPYRGNPCGRKTGCSEICHGARRRAKIQDQVDAKPTIQQLGCSQLFVSALAVAVYRAYRVSRTISLKKSISDINTKSSAGVTILREALEPGRFVRSGWLGPTMRVPRRAERGR
jgi:hypothetical protein